MKYEITISEIEEENVEQRDYKQIGKEENGDPKYGYVDTGKFKIERNKKPIYVQEKEGLDVAELAIYINRAR